MRYGSTEFILVSHIDWPLYSQHLVELFRTYFGSPGLSAGLLFVSCWFG